METKKRFRPNLRQYRILEAANKELTLAAKDASIEFGLMNAEMENWKREYKTQEAISKDLMARRSANLLEIANLNRTAAMGFLLAIVTIMVSAYQIAHAIQSL